LNHQDNFVKNLKIMSNAAKNFDILATDLNDLYNYFDSLTKNYFSNLAVSRILYLLTKPFFSCM